MRDNDGLEIVVQIDLSELGVSRSDDSYLGAEEEALDSRSRSVHHVAARLRREPALHESANPPRDGATDRRRFTDMNYYARPGVADKWAPTLSANFKQGLILKGYFKEGIESLTLIGSPEPFRQVL